jgi:hypothetical protein
MESNNISYKEVQGFIDACDVRPGRNSLLVTVNTYEVENDLLDIDADQDVMMEEWQYVIAAGSGAMYKPGDRVMLNLKALVTKVPDPNDKYKTMEVFDLPGVAVAGKMFAFVRDTVILADRDKMEDEVTEPLSV